MNIEFLKELKKVYSIVMPYDKNGHVNKNFGQDFKTFQKYYNMEKGKYYQYFDELITLTQDLNTLEVLSYFS
ncbi:MAG TPA: hypothetical protein DIU45_06185, partial [Clostridium sp.]|nr:hypothetical protein [Clostridium sp.]